MKKSIILSLMLMLAMFTMAQTNFSGNWELAKAKSKLNAEFSMAPLKLAITQDANLLKSERHSEFQGNEFTSNSSYTLDGKESVNDGFQDTKTKSIAKWNDDKTVLTIDSKLDMQEGNEMKITETYQLVNNELTIVSKASSSWGDMQETWVFEKK